MPAVIDPTVCNRNYDQCFPAKICPNDAIHQVLNGDVVIQWELCGTCPGPCVNFCDGYAIRYDPDPVSFDVFRRQVLGEISTDEAVEERQRLAAERKAAERAASTVVDLDEDRFVELLQGGDLPLIVDFWAPWCGPCKMFAPIFERVADEYRGRAVFAKLNTEEHPQIAAQFRITSIPTLLVLDGAQVVDGAVGALPESQFRNLVERVARPKPDQGETLEVDAADGI